MDEFLVFFRKRVEPFIALAILLLLVILSLQLYNGNNLREEISNNCGWGEEDYRCFCEKSEAMELKNKIDDMKKDFWEEDYVEVDR